MLADSCALDMAETKLKIVIGFVVQIKDVVDKNEVIQNENENHALQSKENKYKQN